MSTNPDRPAEPRETGAITPSERARILALYQARSTTFAGVAARRRQGRGLPRSAAARTIAAGSVPRAVREAPSRRELEVLALVACGLSNSEIGERLTLSEETIKTHIRNALSKLLARNRTHAVVLALSEGLIAFPDR